MAEIIPFPSRRRVRHLRQSAEGAAYNSKTVGAARNRLAAIVEQRRKRLVEIGCAVELIEKDCREHEFSLNQRMFEFLYTNKMLG
ncbi:MAG TPA: DUF6074 family protein [Xanthobacteraceae bacterium]|nr:DUF6074 family protein [Xanthobacteraceae bacterium]